MIKRWKRIEGLKNKKVPNQIMFTMILSESEAFREERPVQKKVLLQL